MRAGFGKAEITPPPGVELAGYGYYLGRKCDSVRDPLYARAVMIENGEDRQLIVSCDLLGLSREVTDQMLADAASLGVPRDRVMIVSIHTHTGPVVKYHNGCGEVDEAYVASLAERIRPALSAAAGDLAEVTRLTFTRGTVEGDYIYNRADPEGPVDREARGFRLERRGAPPILLAGAACHGVFLRCVSCVSADFSGELHRLCAEEGVCSIYLNGLCGDIDPWQPSPERMKAYAARIVETLRGDPRELPMTLRGGRLPFTLRRVAMTRETIHETAARALEKYGGAEKPAARAALAWEKELTEKADSLIFDEPGEAAFCVLGGVPILALPFEGFTEIGRTFRRETGLTDAMVLGCAEELGGYLPTRDDYERGSYAALESMFLYRRLPARAGEAERLAEQLVHAYRQLGPD